MPTKKIVKKYEISAEMAGFPKSFGIEGLVFGTLSKFMDSVYEGNFPKMSRSLSFAISSTQPYWDGDEGFIIEKAKYLDEEGRIKDYKSCFLLYAEFIQFLYSVGWLTKRDIALKYTADWEPYTGEKIKESKELASESEKDSE